MLPQNSDGYNALKTDSNFSGSNATQLGPEYKTVWYEIEVL
jgi:hypothetical protein